MVAISLVRIRDHRCEQWDIDSLIKRSLAPVLGKRLVQFEAMQGQAIIPARILAMWASAFETLDAGCTVNIEDAPAESLHLWDTDIVVFFMDACNATRTIQQAEICMKLNMRVVIASGASEIYRAFAPNADNYMWCSLDVREAAGILETDVSFDPDALIPAYQAANTGDYCPYFVPVSLARMTDGAPRDVDSIIAEIRALRDRGILTKSKHVVFDSPFDEATSTSLMIEIASRLVTLEITWCAWLPTNLDARDIALFRRSGLVLASLGKSMNFNTLMHDVQSREIRAKAVSMLKTRGVAVTAEFIIRDESAFKEMEKAWHIIRSGIDIPIVSLYVPYPESAEYRRLDADGQILSHDWSLYDGEHVVYQTQACAGHTLERKCREMQTDLNSGIRMIARILFPDIRQIAMWKNALLSTAETTAMRIALASSARKTVQCHKKTQLRMLSDVILVGKY